MWELEVPAWAGVRLGGRGSPGSEGGACSTPGPLHTSGLAWAPLRCLATA